MVFVTGLLIFSFHFVGSQRILSTVARDYIDKIRALVLENTENYFGPVEDLVLYYSSILPEYIDSDMDNEEFGDLFFRLSAPHFGLQDHVVNLYIGDERGNFWMNTREPDGSISTLLVERRNGQEINRRVYREHGTERIEALPDYSYDPRLRPWYQQSAEQNTVNWTQVYIFSASQRPGITVSTPVLDRNGNFIAAAGADIFVEDIADFLSELQVGQRGQAFLLDQAGLIDSLTRISDPGVISTSDVETAFIEFLHFQEDKNADSTILQFQANEALLAAFAPLSSQRGLNWYAGIVVPEDDFLSDKRAFLFMSIVLTLVTLAGTLSLSIIFSRKITRPLLDLVGEAAKIQAFDLNDAVDVDTTFAEIERLQQAFENMKSGLRSFRKFVPADLVRSLLSRGIEAELGGEEKSASILFADIINFTGHSENMTAGTLVQHLGDFMGRISEIILDEHGTVDKYIGDALMAFWNAPNSVDDHGYKACCAALRIQERLYGLREEWTAAGLPAFRVKIGVNTGSVVIGNMGSESRLNYTVTGDPVNVASRLESLCGIYGTSILISSDCLDACHGKIFARQIDRVSVKGKAKSVDIYEVMGYSDQIDENLSSLRSSYEASLQLYFQRDWSAAEAAFCSLLKKFPEDQASRLLAERCRTYLTNPPPDSWNGEFVFLQK
ncbi:adenylate/guanylate cyclase domain-containing protein [Spirochaeta dissipatitropha]